MEITGSLKNSLAELYFKEECSQKGWAIASPKEIYNGGFTEDNALPFELGGKGVKIKIMSQLVPEIKEMSRPGGRREGKTTVFSYLACRIGHSAAQDSPVVANPTALCWVHIKTKGTLFSESQVEALPKVSLAITVFAIRDVLAPPRNLQTRWDTRSGNEWLDLIDELKEQEEYDDEYF